MPVGTIGIAGVAVVTTTIVSTVVSTAISTIIISIGISISLGFSISRAFVYLRDAIGGSRGAHVLVATSNRSSNNGCDRGIGIGVGVDRGIVGEEEIRISISRTLAEMPVGTIGIAGVAVVTTTVVSTVVSTAIGTIVVSISIGISLGFSISRAFVYLRD